MFTYTIRELKLLMLSLTLLILLIYNLVIFPTINSIFYLNTNKFYSNYIYSKTIPINSHEYINNKDDKENNLQVNKKKKKNNTQMSKSQRNTIKENQNIKWRIQIPKINLDVHIMEGTSSNILLKAVGHFETTEKWIGNVGLAAHNRGYNCNFFEKIKYLKIGDEIIYTTTNGKKVYKVQTNKVIKDTDWSYLGATKDNRITLITCEENREEYRRCIQALEVASYKI